MWNDKLLTDMNVFFYQLSPIVYKYIQMFDNKILILTGGGGKKPIKTKKQNNINKSGL